MTTQLLFDRPLDTVNRRAGQTPKGLSIFSRAVTALILAAVLSCAGRVEANVLTWTGGGTTSYWSDSGNWGGVGTPNFGDTVVFVGGAPRFWTTNNFAGLVLNRVCFTGASGGYIIYGNAFTVTNAIQTTNVTGVNTIFPDLTLATTNVTVNVSNAATLILEGNVQGSVGLVKTGAGTLEFSGNPANTYLGTTWVNTGTLILNRNGSFNAFAGPLVISDGSATAVVLSAQSDELPGTAMTINQGGTLNLNGFFDDAGTLVTLNGNGSISTGTGTLILPSNATVYANPGFIEADSISGNLNVGAGPCTFAVSFDVGSLAVGAQVSGSGIINVTSNGFMSLNASNSFTGQLNVQNAAMLTINNNYALGATNSSVTLSNSAQLNVPDGLGVTGKTLIDDSGNTNGSFNLVGANADSGWVGPIVLATQTAVNVASNGSFYFAGVVSGPGGITEIGEGALLFSGPGNTYTGQTTVVSNSVLGLGTTSGYGIEGNLDVGGLVYCTVPIDQLAPTCNLNIEYGGDFSVGYTSFQQCNKLTGQGTLDLGSQGMQVGFVGSGVYSQFDGLITNTGYLEVEDCNLTLTGNNTYTGPTYVLYSGQLNVNGYQPNSTVYLLLDGTLFGTGTVGSIYSSGGDLVPGFFGILTCGNVALTNNSTYNAYLFGSQPGTGYGQLYPSSATSINIEGATLVVEPDFKADDAPTNGQKYVIINNPTAFPITGEFFGLPEGSIATAANGMQFIVTYDQQVVLTYTNPPSEQVNPAFAAGNGSGFLEPDECSDLNVSLVNPGTNALQGVTAVLRSLTPGVAVTQPFSPYPDIAPGGAAGNLAPFQIQTQPWLNCPTNVNFQMSYSSTSAGLFSVPFTMQLGAPLQFDNFTSTPIPDNGEVISDVAVSGLTAPISKVDLLMYLTHTYDSDLVVDLVAPDNTTVHLLNKDGHNGQNFGSACGAAGTETVFDDFGTINVSNGVAPFVGVYQPVSPLSALIGKTPAQVNNLKWNLNVSDTEPGNTGTLQCWSLRIWPGTCTDGGGLCELCPNTTIYSALGTTSPLLDRLSRSGAASTCAQPTLFPGYEGELNYYDAYTFRNGPSDACISVTLTAPTVDLFSSSFLNTFNPTNSAATYLGDSGFATLDAVGTTAVNYSFHVASNAVFIVTVNGISADYGPYALQVTGGSCQPLLNINPAGTNNVALSWTTAAGGYLLESSNHLGQSTPAWQTVNPPPVVVGTNYVVTNAATGADQFYRLRKPQP